MPDQWTLVRLAIVAIDEPPQTRSFSLLHDGVDARIGGAFSGKEGKPLGVLGVAAVPLPNWAPSSGHILIPEDQRRRAEKALEILCRLIALDQATTMSLRSPFPCLGLVGPDTDRLAIFDGFPVLLAARTPTLVGGGPTDFIEQKLSPRLLFDRLDGVTLVTEAFNTEPGVGQFTQFWRLFERAFKCGHTDAVPLLVSFLGRGPHQFEVAEVAHWATLRNPAIHANRGGDPVLNSDVFFLLGRMREAVLDVLFNKQNWWAKDDLRRDAWKPAAGSTGGGGIFMTRGRGANLRGVAPDEFGAFPRAFFGPLHSMLPDGLWLKSDASAARVERLGAGPLEPFLDTVSKNGSDNDSAS